MSTKNLLSILTSFTACSLTVHTALGYAADPGARQRRSGVIGRSGTRQTLRYTTNVQATLLPNTLASQILTQGLKFGDLTEQLDFLGTVWQLRHATLVRTDFAHDALRQQSNDEPGRVSALIIRRFALAR